MIVDVIEIVLAQMPVDTGMMLRRGANIYETPHAIIVDYDTNALPYIIYQEEGFKHYITKKMVKVNQGFISRKTVGQITRYGWSMTLDLPFNKEENNEKLLQNQSKMLEEIGAIQNV